LQFFQPVDVCSHGIDGCLASAQILDSLISFLLGNGVRFEQALPARCGDLCQLLIRLGVLEARSCLLQLLIDLGSVDLRQ
jgi:hypothetical protein